MKKLLLATTMLITAGNYAAADVAVSGDARMGIVSTDGESRLTSRVRISFSGSGTTDGGLAFGGSVRADNSTGGAAGTSGAVYLSGAFGKLSMGDVDSADSAAVGQLAGVGYTGLGDSNEVQYSADGFSLFDLDKDLLAAAKEYNDRSTTNTDDYAAKSLTVTSPASKVLYTYTAGSLSASASASQIGDYQSYAVGASYATGALTLAAGYGSSEVNVADDVTTSTAAWEGNGDVTDTTAAASYVMGTTTLKAIYQDKQFEGTSTSNNDATLTETSYGASVQHKMDAITVTGFGITADLHDGIFGDDDLTLARYGVGASYDLGGGATLAGGVARIESANVAYGSSATEIIDSTESQTVFDIGVNFSF